MHSYDAGLNVKNGFPVFSTCLEANYISKKEDNYRLDNMTDEDRMAIHELARDPKIGGIHY
jgi:DNA replication licensing factor MCM2